MIVDYQQLFKCSIICLTTPLRHLVSARNDERMNAGIVQSNLCWKIHNKYVFHVNIHIFVEKKSLYCWHIKKFRKKYLRQPSSDFDFCNISSSCDVVYKGRWLTQAGYWSPSGRSLSTDYVPHNVCCVLTGYFTCSSSKIQNAIKLENITL
jgi:hypothetical protein